MMKNPLLPKIHHFDGLCISLQTHLIPQTFTKVPHGYNVMHLQYSAFGCAFRQRSEKLCMLIGGMYNAGPGLDGASVYNMLEDFRVGATAGVPTVFLGLLEHMAAQNKKLHYLKMAAIGGAACPPKIIEKFNSMGIETRHAWGMTETSPIATAGSLKVPMGIFGCCAVFLQL